MIGRTMIALACAVGVMSCRAKQDAERGGESAAVGPVRVTARVATVTSATFGGVLDATGIVTVRAGHVASLGAPGASRVAAVQVSVGDRVRVGAILVELDAAPFVAAEQSAAAALTASTLAHERAKRLVDAGIAPRKDLDLATSDLAQSTSAAANARRVRRLATLRAPINGVVTRVSAVLGASVDGTAPLVDVADPAFVDIVLNVSPSEAARLNVGAGVLLLAGAVEGSDSLGSGLITTVAAAIDTASRSVAVRVTAPNTRRVLRVGESVIGRIALERRTDVILVAAAAVVPNGDAHRVFVVDSTGIAHARDVTVGARRDGRVEITTGLKRGERIVTDGAYQVDDGVRIVPPSP
jgi:membrane fusion protein, multidrug efflux system